MDNEKSSPILVALVVAVLTILTAWGNSWAMLIVSAVILGPGGAVLQGRLLRGAWLMLVVGGIVAALTQPASPRGGQAHPGGGGFLARHEDGWARPEGDRSRVEEVGSEPC